MHNRVKDQITALTAKLKAELAHIPAGERFLSVRTIQNKFAINIRVAQAALRALCKEGAIEIIPRAGIFSKGTFFNKNIPSLFLLLPEYPSHLNSLFVEKLGAYAKHSGQLRLRKIMFHYESDFFSIPGVDLESCDVMSLITASHSITSGELLFLAKQTKPLLALFKHFEELSIHSIVGDDYLNGTIAARHFLENGHRKLAVLICEPRLYGIDLAARAFCNVAELGGAECCEIDCKTKSGEFPSAKACDILTAFLAQSKHKFTALYVIGDAAVPGAMTALRQANLAIPGDVSIIGNGNLQESQFLEPPLTTVGLNIDDLVAVFVKTLLGIINNPAQIQHVNLTPQLYKRMSVKQINS